MPFAAGDRERIRKHLGIARSLNLKQDLQRAMDELDEDEVTTALACLTKLDTLEETRSTNNVSKDRALIQADVLRWDPNYQSAGIGDELGFYRQRLAETLGIVGTLWQPNNVARLYSRAIASGSMVPPGVYPA